MLVHSHRSDEDDEVDDDVVHDTAEERQPEDSTAGIEINLHLSYFICILFDEPTTKRQKVELDDEKEDLKGYLDIVPREDVVVDVDSLSTKYPIIDWKTYTLSENFMYYKIIRGDGSSKNYKILSEMLYDFDRQDIVKLYRLVKGSSHSADAKWNCHTYAYRKEVSSKSRNDIKDA
ncbi:hypothetical protein Tco_0143396, partial [Tanacetum coccineum]